MKEIKVTEKLADGTRRKREIDPMQINFVNPRLRECVIQMDDGEQICVAEDADELGELIKEAQE